MIRPEVRGLIICCSHPTVLPAVRKLVPVGDIGKPKASQSRTIHNIRKSKPNYHADTIMYDMFLPFQASSQIMINHPKSSSILPVNRIAKIGMRRAFVTASAWEVNGTQNLPVIIKH